MWKFLRGGILTPRDCIKYWRVIALLMNAALPTNLRWLIANPEPVRTDWMVFQGSVVAAVWRFEVAISTYAFWVSVSVLAGTVLAGLTATGFWIARKGEMPPRPVRVMLTSAFFANLAVGGPHVIGALAVLTILVVNVGYVFIAVIPPTELLSILAQRSLWDILQLAFLVLVDVLAVGWMVIWGTVLGWRYVSAGGS